MWILQNRCSSQLFLLGSNCKQCIFNNLSCSNKCKFHKLSSISYLTITLLYLFSSEQYLPLPKTHPMPWHCLQSASVSLLHQEYADHPSSEKSMQLPDCCMNTHIFRDIFSSPLRYPIPFSYLWLKDGLLFLTSPFGNVVSIVNLPVSRPCSNGEYACIDTPSSLHTGNNSFSTFLVTILYFS